MVSLVKDTQKIILVVLICLPWLLMVIAVEDEKMTIKIGVVIDENSGLGKEQKTAMEVAVESFNSNNGGMNHTLSLTFIHYNHHLLQTLLSAQNLVEENQAQVIIVGVDNWQVASLLAQVGSQAQVPTFSLVASPHLTPPVPYSLQWPFLVQMAHDGSQQVRDLVSIIRANHWRRVTLVSEGDPNAGDVSSLVFLMTEALQKIGAQIEHHVILPAFDSKKATPNENATQEAFSKFLDQGCYSRVFVVLKVSRPYVSQLFKEARRMGLMGNDSVWITDKTVTNLLPCCLDNTTMESMVGALGLMTKFDDSTKPFKAFQDQFVIKTSNKPSFDALVAYDAITIINNKSATILKSRHHFLREILQTNFEGLSGHIQFDPSKNTLLRDTGTKLVNIIGNNKYREILTFHISNDTDTEKELVSEVIIWPGNKRGGVPPKGWGMPTRDKPMIIGVPINHSYKNFINYIGQDKDEYGVPKTKGNITRENEEYSGFCPEIFREVLKILGYDLPYRFIPYYGSYNDLIYHVYNKSYDAIVGDLTILENRTELVEFTLPYAESALSIVVPAVEAFNSNGPLIFLRPFTLGLWLLTLSLLLWTMLAVWLLEFNNNQEFNGPWMTQLSTALWFIFSTLFFAQRERISSNSARMVVVTWLFIVLVLTQSYTANLTSMLTVDKLSKTSIDIEMLIRGNESVGYDNSSFVKIFLEDIFHFDGRNIVGIESQLQEFHNQFQLGNIKAAFLELLYAQIFLNQYCNQYTITTPGYRYGGLAFVFPKGSPVANDVSKAILKLTENGTLSKLKKKNLKLKSECYISTDDDFSSNSDSTGGGGSGGSGGSSGGGDQSSSLRLNSFWILFVFSAGISTLCFLAFLLPSFNIMRWRRLPPNFFA